MLTEVHFKKFQIKTIRMDEPGDKSGKSRSCVVQFEDRKSMRKALDFDGVLDLRVCDRHEMAEDWFEFIDECFEDVKCVIS